MIHGRFLPGGLPLITYATRGGGGVKTNAYKCVQGGRGGLNMTKNTHFVRRFIENTAISGTFKDRELLLEGILRCSPFLCNTLFTLTYYISNKREYF